MGCIVFNCDMHRVSEFSEAYYAQSAIQAEALAIHKALCWASRSKLYHVLIQSDCLSAVLQIATRQKVDYQLRIILEDIFTVLALFHCCSVSFIPRAFNKKAYTLASSVPSMY